MPAQSKPKTLTRLLDLLQAIPRRSSVSAQDLHTRLTERGHAVTIRSVQRDLQMLREHFPLEVNENSKPHSWRWGVEADQGIGGMNAHEALMVALAEKHLRTALPGHMADSFDTVFEEAHRRLKKIDGPAGMPRWIDKVAVVSPGLMQLAPEVDKGMRRVLSTALLEGEQVEVYYARVSPTTPERVHSQHYILHPLGMVLRGSITYLIASQGWGRPPGFYALHRFRRARPLGHPVRLPSPEWTLDGWLASGQAQFGMHPDKPPLALSLACSQMMANMIREAPLGPDQEIESMADGRRHVQVTVADTWELRWWLLGRSADVQVLAPVALREAIRQSLKQALDIYDGQFVMPFTERFEPD